MCKMCDVRVLVFLLCHPLSSTVAEDKLLFNQMPLLEIDGLCLVQQRAILAYLGVKTGMLGKDNVENAR